MPPSPSSDEPEHYFALGPRALAYQQQMNSKLAQPNPGKIYTIISNFSNKQVKFECNAIFV